MDLIKDYEHCMETEGHPGLDELLVRMDHEKAWDYEQKAKQILAWTSCSCAWTTKRRGTTSRKPSRYFPN